MTTWQVMNRIADEKVIAIVRSPDTAKAEQTCHTLIGAGVGVIEVSLTTPGALDIVAQLAQHHGERVVVGVGTVLTAADARLASLAGARLVVTPVFDADTVHAARRYGMATVIGCGSATEMLTALSAGADAVKLFPASSWSPGDLRGVLDALPQLPVVPTGGVNVENAPHWIAAGAVAVGIGSSLTSGGHQEARSRYLALRDAIGGAPGHRPGGAQTMAS